jgi:hypothetical protein
VTDTGGSPWDIGYLSGLTYTSFGDHDEWVAFAQKAGIPKSSDGTYELDLNGGVDWSKLRVIDPCVTQRTCR